MSSFSACSTRPPPTASDKAALPEVEQEWARTPQEAPLTLYVDAGYTSGPQLARAEAEGRQLLGPVSAAPRRGQRYSADDLAVNLPERQALCPDGQPSRHCCRLEESAGRVSYRFEWSPEQCGGCPLRGRCVGSNPPHRTLVVSEYHPWLQERRRAMGANFMSRCPAPPGSTHPFF